MSISVPFKIPIVGSMVMYVKRKIVQPKIRFMMLVNGEVAMNVNVNRADMAEARYILADETMSMLTLSFFVAITSL